MTPTPNTPAHGETHTCCNARLQAEGGKARCCRCVPHDGCELTNTPAKCPTCGSRSPNIGITYSTERCPDPFHGQVTATTDRKPIMTMDIYDGGVAKPPKDLFDDEPDTTEPTVHRNVPTGESTLQEALPSHSDEQPTPPLAAPDALEQIRAVLSRWRVIQPEYEDGDAEALDDALERDARELARLTQEARIDEVTQAIAAFDGLDVSSDPAYNGTKHLRARLAELNVKGDKHE